jgi:hypothetical protein
VTCITMYIEFPLVTMRPSVSPAPKSKAIGRYSTLCLCKSSRYAKNLLRLLTLPPAPAARAGPEGLRSLAGFA